MLNRRLVCWWKRSLAEWVHEKRDRSDTHKKKDEGKRAHTQIQFICQLHPKETLRKLLEQHDDLEWGNWFRRLIQETCSHDLLLWEGLHTSGLLHLTTPCCCELWWTVKMHFGSGWLCWQVLSTREPEQEKAEWLFFGGFIDLELSAV